MPLSRNDLTPILRELTALNHAIGAAAEVADKTHAQYSELATKISEKKEALLCVLLPSKTQPHGKGVSVNLMEIDPFPDISQSELNLEKKAALKNLARFCVERLPHEGMQRPEETLCYLTGAAERLVTAKSPAPPRLVVDLERLSLALDGQTYEVGSENALRWLRVLVAHPGVWISGKELENYDPELLNPRTDRWKDHLPHAVRDLIDSETGKGSRIFADAGRP